MAAEKSHRFIIHVKRDEDGWLVATVDGLPGVHTQARTLAQLEERIRGAILLYQEMETPKGKGMKRTDSKGLSRIARKFEGTFRIEVPA